MKNRPSYPAFSIARGILLILLSIITFKTDLSAQEHRFVPGELIILLRSQTSIEDFRREYNTIADVTSLKTELLSYGIPVYRIRQSALDGRETDICAKLQSFRSLHAAQLNYLVQPRVLPNDTGFGDQWALNNTGQSGGVADADVDATEAWNLTTGGLTAAGDTIVIAVVDAGIQLNHPDLQANTWINYGEIPGNNTDDDNNGYIDDVNGWNAYNNNGNLPADQHGTHVAGIIGARGNNASGVSGINWKVKIMNIAGSSGNTATVISAYSYALQQRRLYNATDGNQGAFVVAVNSSFGVDFGQPSSFPVWCAFYDTMGAAGILNVGATANANTNVDLQGDIPTACPSNYLVTVTNSTRNDVKNTAAGYGAATIDLAAPGTAIYSTITGSNYGNLSGTSMATPLVAGTIGLLYSYPCPTLGILMHQDPAAFALLVKQALLQGVDELAVFSANTVSGGRLNARNALDSLALVCATPLPVGLSFFEVRHRACTVTLSWKATASPDLVSFTIEAGSDGLNFEERGTVKAARTDQQYSFLLPDARQGFYRLRLNTQDAAPAYSPVAAIALTGCAGQSPVVYPNPLSGSQWILEGGKTGQHAFLFDALGKVMWQGIIEGHRQIIPAAQLPKGFYILEIQEKSHVVTRHKLARL